MKHFCTRFSQSQNQRSLLLFFILAFALIPSLMVAKSLDLEEAFGTQTINKTYGAEPFTVQIDYHGSEPLKFKYVTKIDNQINNDITIFALAKKGTAWEASIFGAGNVIVTAYTGDINTPTIVEIIEVTIAKAILKVIPNETTRPYGVKNPAVNTAYKYEKFINPDDEKLFNSLPIAYIDPIYNESTLIGTYPGGVKSRGGSHPFYILKHETATLGIKGIIIFPPEITRKTYGDPEFKLIESTMGIQTLEVESSAPNIISVSEETGEWIATIRGVGTVTISYKSIDDIGQEETKLIPIVVQKKPLVITADDQYRLENEDNPTLTYTTTDLAYDETIDVLTEIITSTDATKYSPKGEYVIQIEGGEGDNYITTLITGKLTIYNSSLLEVYVNTELIEDISKPYDMGCSTSNEQYVQIKVTEDATLVVPGYTLDQDNGFRVVTDKPMTKDIVFKIQSPIAGREETFTLTIQRNFVFDDIAIMRWNNTLSVVNNPANLFGYTIAGYQWYKNDIALVGETKQHYSAGSESYAVLDENAKYHVEFKMTSGEILKTCQKQVVLTNNEYTVEITPNPARVGETLTLKTNMDENDLVNATIDIYTIGGVFVKKVSVTGKTTLFTLPSSAGMYLVKFTASSGFNQTHKVLVK